MVLAAGKNTLGRVAGGRCLQNDIKVDGAESTLGSARGARTVAETSAAGANHVWWSPNHGVAHCERERSLLTTYWSEST